ncbi:unnamed protein product [Amaranthus hypochondriacus]
MGFRDLRIFNKALLAKQVWRIHNGECPLVNDILRARYYKHSDILNANLGHNPSYSWRGLWDAKSLLKDGLCWRVGNGLSIAVWEDPWLIRDGKVLQLSPSVADFNDLRVADLINFETGEWDLSGREECFPTDVRALICNLPLSRLWPVDSLFWIFTKDGRYSVRSGYWMGTLGLGSLSPPVSSDHVEHLWDKVWSIDCPPKARHFLWRACNNSLAVNSIRHHRHIASSPVCEGCGLFPETIFHALIECSWVHHVWVGHPDFPLVSSAPKSSFKDFLAWVIEHGTSQSISSITAVLWALWTARNQRIFNGHCPNISTVVTSFSKMVRDYNVYAERVFKCPLPTSSISPSRWSPPEVEWVKVNFDANIADNDERGLGAVARNADGLLLVAGVRRIKASWNVELSELMAAAYGLELARRLGYSHVILEGDCSTVIHGIWQCPRGFSPFFLILDYIQSLLPSFLGFRCSLIRRQCITVAHFMAQWNLETCGEIVLMDPFLSSLVSLTLSDII